MIIHTKVEVIARSFPLSVFCIINLICIMSVKRIPIVQV